MRNPFSQAKSNLSAVHCFLPLLPAASLSGLFILPTAAATCRFLLPLLFLLSTLNANAWGFWGHQRINRIAVFLLPPEMISFYKENIDFITEHAVDPDKRRYSVAEEAPRHYIDLDHYCTLPCDSMPHRWKDAVAKYSEDTLKAYGIVPWHIQTMMYRLEDAFKAKDKQKILRTSAEIGHYIADSNVPLHTTENYNGAQTNQVGIHGFWESRIPELFGDDYDYFIGKAEFVAKPSERIWATVMESHRALDSVFGFEKQISQSFPADRKYAFDTRGVTTGKMYSAEYTEAYSKMMDGMVERKMRRSIKMVADIWFTCWVNAGSPDLKKIETHQLTAQEQEEIDAEEKAWREKKKTMYGHPHAETGSEGTK